MLPPIIHKTWARIARKAGLKDGIDFLESESLPAMTKEENKISIQDMIFNGNRRSRRKALSYLRKANAIQKHAL